MKNAEEFKLKLKVIEAEKEVEECRKKFFAKRKELTDAETNLVNAKEVLLRSEETLREYRYNYVGENSVMEHRDQQIEEYRQRMPELMKRIENEPQLQYAAIWDLDTTSSPGYKK